MAFSRAGREIKRVGSTIFIFHGGGKNFITFILDDN